MDRDIPINEIKGIPHLDTSFLPIFRQYRQENESWIPDFDIWSYLNLRADFDLAAAFSKLFFPDFVEVDGCVILKEQYSPENFKDWMQRYNGDRRAVESLINHVHISDTFLNSPHDVQYPEQLYQYLVEILMFGWKQVLQEEFPDKQFVFTVRNYELSFHQAGEK